MLASCPKELSEHAGLVVTTQRDGRATLVVKNEYTCGHSHRLRWRELPVSQSLPMGWRDSGHARGRPRRKYEAE